MHYAWESPLAKMTLHYWIITISLSLLHNGILLSLCNSLGKCRHFAFCIWGLTCACMAHRCLLMKCPIRFPSHLMNLTVLLQLSPHKNNEEQVNGANIYLNLNRGEKTQAEGVFKKTPLVLINLESVGYHHTWLRLDRTPLAWKRGKKTTLHSHGILI